MRIFPIFFIIYCFIFHKGLLFWALYIKKCLDDINQSLLLHNINNFIWYYSVVLFSIFCPLACRVHSFICTFNYANNSVTKVLLPSIYG